MTALVVCRDGHIDELGWGVCITKGYNGDIDVRCFFDGLCVGAWVGDYNEARFLEGAGDVVGEVPRGETACDGGGAGVRGEFEDGALAVGTGGDDGYIGGVVDCGDDAGCEDDFLPV